jgi:UDP-3-O-[3-hydroxymyristoyl] glucosamine N-acyltransferase
VTIRERCTIGNRVILHPGVVIGACGFGYHSDATGHHKLRQLGVVVLEDDVEIGANSCIDRARFGETLIGRGTKIDNLVQVAHGVVLGEDNMIVGQVGIAGSATTGKRVVVAGQAAINGHVHITDDVILAARAGAIRSIDTPGKYGGTPAQPLKLHMRNVAAMCKLGEYVGTLKKMMRNAK